MSFYDTMDDTRRCLFPDSRLESSDEASESTLMPMHPGISDHHSDEDKSHFLSRTSPTTVADVFVDGPVNPLNPMIEVGEDGTEVTLALADLSLSTPQKVESMSKSRKNSLMDLCTPPSNAKDCTPTPRCANIWCGNPSINCIQEENDFEIPSGKSLEAAISDYLSSGSSPSRWNGCSDWQDWTFLVDKESQKRMQASSSKRLRNLRQKAFHLKTRKTRVRQLRRDLSPFGKSPRKASEFIRSKSFSVSDHASAITRNATEFHKSKHRYNFLQLCSLPEQISSQSPIALRYTASEETKDECYDSDPEDFTRIQSPCLKPIHKRCFSSDSTRNEAGSLCHKTAIQQFLNRTFTLIFHPATKPMQTSSPVAVNALLERGQLLNDLIQPKWIFQAKSKDSYNKRSLVNQEIMKKIELLTITRVLELPVVDRAIYPFAKPFKSFLIRTVDKQEYCFETQSIEECDLIAYSLKMAISRFGAMVISSDNDVYDEFFANDNYIPGEAPQLLNLGNGSNSYSFDSDDSDFY